MFNPKKLESFKQYEKLTFFFWLYKSDLVTFAMTKWKRKKTIQL